MRCCDNAWRPLALGLAAALLLRGARRRWRRARRSPRSFSFAAPATARTATPRWRKSRRSPASRRSSSLNQLFLMREGVRKVEAMAPIVKDLKDERSDGAVRALRQACAQAQRRAARSGAGQARRGDRDAAALRLVPSADARRPGPDAAAGQAAHRLSGRVAEIVPRQPAPGRRHGDERAWSAPADADLVALAHYAASL